MNGVTTSYTLDLNAGLTQVLAGDDGSRYVYGLGRLAQGGAGPLEKPMLRHPKFILIILAAVVLLEGCSSPTIVPAPPIESTTPTALVATPTSIPTKPAPTLTPLPAGPATTSTVVLPPENILKYQPLEISSNLPADVKPAGALLVGRGEQLQLLHFDPQVRLENFSVIDTSACLSTSPDGKWLAYCPGSDDFPTGQWLIVESVDRQQQKKVAVDVLFFYGSYFWLDNQRLIFPTSSKEQPWLGPMVVVNPFTGNQTELPSDYPGITGTRAGPIGTLAFETSSLVYDPSLNLVVFPERISPHNYIVLWDRRSSSVLARVEDKGEFLNYPLWSPDAEQFVVAASTHELGLVEEWFSVSREGQVGQLTHFGEYFSDAQIHDGQWSTDGKYLAFWLYTSPSLCSNPVHLAILDMTTKQVTDTCVSVMPGYTLHPFWSFDNRYISVVIPGESSRQSILIDIEQGRAFDITTAYGVPFGWLALP